MTRTRKLLGAVLLSAVVAANVVTTAYAADATETYAYLPDRSVYFYDVTENHGWAAQKIDSLAAAEVTMGALGAAEGVETAESPVRASATDVTGPGVAAAREEEAMGEVTAADTAALEDDDNAEPGIEDGLEGKGDPGTVTSAEGLLVG